MGHGLNGIGVVGGLLFTGVSLRSETKTRRVANLLAITQNHRDIWIYFSKRPELERILSATVDLAKEPTFRGEKTLINFVIL